MCKSSPEKSGVSVRTSSRKKTQQSVRSKLGVQTTHEWQYSIVLLFNKSTALSDMAVDFGPSSFKIHELGSGGPGLNPVCRAKNIPTRVSFPARITNLHNPSLLCMLKFHPVVRLWGGVCPLRLPSRPSQLTVLSGVAAEQMFATFRCTERVPSAKSVQGLRAGLERCQPQP
jgi:hypothetical protein